jgi:hypothetical protein
MATNLEDVVKQLHKNNTETANLNRNFKQWFLAQERARLDALEKERESKSDKSDKPVQATKVGNDKDGLNNLGLFGLAGLAGKLGTFLAGIGALGLAMAGLRGWELPLIKKLNSLTGFTAKIGDIIEETKGKFKTNFKTLIPRLGIQIRSMLRPLTAASTALGAYFLGPGAKIGGFIGKFFGGAARGVVGVAAPLLKLMGKILYPIGILMSVYDGFSAFGKSDEETFLGKFGDGFSAFVGSFIGAPLDLIKNGLVWGIGKMFGLSPGANGRYNSNSGLGRFLNAAKGMSFEETIKGIVKAPFDLFTNAGLYIDELARKQEEGGDKAVFKKLWEDTKKSVYGTIPAAEWLFDLIIGNAAKTLAEVATGKELSDEEFTINPITSIRNFIKKINGQLEIQQEDKDGTVREVSKFKAFFNNAGDRMLGDLKEDWNDIKAVFRKLTNFFTEMPENIMISTVKKLNSKLPEFLKMDTLENTLTKELESMQLRNIERQNSILLKQLQSGNISTGQYLQESAALLRNADRGGRGQLLYQDNTQNNPINNVAINTIPGPLRLSASGNDNTFGATANTGKKGPAGI